MTDRPEENPSDNVLEISDPDALRTLRRQIQRQVQQPAEAFTIDGRTFSFEAPLSTGLAIGGFVALETEAGVEYLGQVSSLEAAEREGPRLTIELDTDLSSYIAGGSISSGETRILIRHLRGTGNVLGRVEEGARVRSTTQSDTFAAASMRPAERSVLEAFLGAGSHGGRAALDVGALALGEDPPRVALQGDGLNRHTFLCGQSGSGKTHSLGLVLERVLQLTSLRFVVLDPNSDYVRLGEIRPAERVLGATGSRSYEELAGLHRAAAAGLRIVRPSAAGDRSAAALRVAFGDLARDEQAAVLQLDPLTDREEYSTFWHMADALGESRYTLTDVKAVASRLLSHESRQVALRIENLGIGDWSIWAGPGEESAADLLDSDDWRALVVDVAALESADERAAVAVATLGRLWSHRADRRPVLIVIDEAHNVCPAEPVSPLQQRATELCIAIAGEGRKYGLYLLLSTQRPQKLHPNVLSQCENLMLMRMNSLADLGNVAETFSFVPRGLLEEATRFRLGECALAGRIVPTPLRARLGGRISEEGGADLPTTWAEPTAS